MNSPALSTTFSLSTEQLNELRTVIGPGRLRLIEPLARYTAARLGGPADVLVEVESADELAQVAKWLWKWKAPFVVLGGGSNVLISDRGFRGVVLLNHARRIVFKEDADPPVVWAEAGANFGLLARQAAGRGLSGLEWAASIPGTLGGAVVGNAGAHGSEIAKNLQMAEILQLPIMGQEAIRSLWPVERMAYAYRSSCLKRLPASAVVLSATLGLQHSDPAAVQSQMEAYVIYRRHTQPPGASMGSMFKNPTGDYAGRLIEAAGLKGIRIGGAEISAVHANFFINHGQATSADIQALIRLAQTTVREKLGVELELEIEMIGE